MTPSKEKKALPSSSFTNAIVIQHQPTTYPQWQTALQHVKIQYLKRQYKQCASRCTQLLTANAGHVRTLLRSYHNNRPCPITKLTNNIASQILPLHRTYLHFYTALSHEALARSAHNLSAAKLRTLHLAREAYEAAAASLPRPTTLPATHTTTDNDDDDEEGADSSASVSAISSPTSSYSDPSSHAPEANEHSPTPPQTPSRTPSPSAATICTDSEKLKPSPLRIRKKAVHFTPAPTPTSTPGASPPRPQLSILSPVLHNAHAVHGYDTQLISFATMLQTHICAVDALLQATDAARGDGAYVEDGEEEEKEARRARRIQRLKGVGWRRERFVAERYVGLCARALAEL